MVAILEAYNFVLVSYKRVGERIVLRGPLNPGARPVAPEAVPLAGRAGQSLVTRRNTVPAGCGDDGVSDFSH